MKIHLESNPADAPCCVKIVAEDGRDLLIQSDWDFPSVAGSFGFRLSDVLPKAPQGYYDWQEGRDGGTPWTPEEEAVFHAYEAQPKCEHRGTDGTIKCPTCGLLPADFISAARQWIDANDGATAKDPGYFED